jgi:hypothetical protein
MAMGLTQPLTEMSTRNLPWGEEDKWRLTTSPPSMGLLSRAVVPKQCAAKYFWGAAKYSNIFTEMTLSKYRAKINMEQEMRVAVSSLIPRFEKMCSEQQAHPSH